MFSDEGYDLNIASTVLEARMLLARRWFDLVYSNSVCPTATAPPLLEHIKNATPGTEVIIMTVARLARSDELINPENTINKLG